MRRMWKMILNMKFIFINERSRWHIIVITTITQTNDNKAYVDYYQN